MRTLLCLAIVLCASVAAACPPVAISSFGVQAVSVCPSVSVQSVVVPQVAVQAVSVAPVQVQTFAVQQQAVVAQAAVVAPLQVACVSGACAQRARVGLLGRLLGSRSRSVARSVSVSR